MVRLAELGAQRNAAQRERVPRFAQCACDRFPRGRRTERD